MLIPDTSAMLPAIAAIAMHLGGNIALLGILHDDHRVLRRMLVVLIAIAPLGVVYFMRSAVVIARAYFGPRHICIANSGDSIPCWCALLQTVQYALLSALCYACAVHREFVSLWKQRDIDRRLELLWGALSSYLFGYSSLNTLFCFGPYCFFPYGRAYLVSPTGIFYVLNIVVAAGLGKFASKKAWISGVQDWFATFGTVTDTMPVALLMATGGVGFDELMKDAKSKARLVSFSNMSIADFDASSHGAYKKSVVGLLDEIDLFVIHSWHDPVHAKWDALTKYCRSFAQQTGQPPKLWIDVYCSHPSAPIELHLLPALLMASKRLVVLLGPTLRTRLWSCMELYMFTEAGGSVDCIDVVPVASDVPRHRSSNRVLGECSSNRDRVTMAKVIEIGCGSVAKFYQRVDCLIQEAQSHRPAAGGGARKSRRLSATLRVFDELQHIVHQFERYKPGCWWLHSFLLYVRLLSTAAMVFIHDQVTQVKIEHAYHRTLTI